jgi:hypothetical protein
MFALARRSSKTAKLDAIERSQAIVTFGLDGLLAEANENFLQLMGARCGSAPATTRCSTPAAGRSGS